MAIETFDFDPAAFLTSEEGIEEFLLAAAEEGDPHVVALAQDISARARQKLVKGRYGGLWRGALKALR